MIEYEYLSFIIKFNFDEDSSTFDRKNISFFRGVSFFNNINVISLLFNVVLYILFEKYSKLFSFFCWDRGYLWKVYIWIFRYRPLKWEKEKFWGQLIYYDIIRIITYAISKTIFHIKLKKLILKISILKKKSLIFSKE